MPSISETLDWAKALTLLNVETLEHELVQDTLSVVLKYEGDIRKAEARILRDVPWVPLYHPANVVVRHPRVRGYALHPLRPARFETVWVAW